MTAAVILQARMGSTRLPGKAMREVLGRPLLSFVMEALRKIPADRYILATDHESRSLFLPLAEAAGFVLFSGSPLDVLRRFREALEAHPADTVIRATGDNPLVSWEMGRRILEEHRARKADYSAFFGLPLGCGVEIIRTEALFRADRDAADPYDREHVSSFLYRRPDLFDLHRPLAEERHRERFSVTVDTPEDFDRVSAGVAALWKEGPPRLADLMAWIRSRDAGEGRG